MNEVPHARRALISPELLPALMVFAATVILVVGMKIANPSFGSFNQLIAILVTAIFLVVASFGQGLVICSAASICRWGWSSRSAA